MSYQARTAAALLAPGLLSAPPMALATAPSRTFADACHASTVESFVWFPAPYLSLFRSCALAACISIRPATKLCILINFLLLSI